MGHHLEKGHAFGIMFEEESEARSFYMKVASRKPTAERLHAPKKRSAETGPQGDRYMQSGSETQTLDPSWNVFLHELEVHGVSRNMIQENMGFIQNFVREAHSVRPSKMTDRAWDELSQRHREEIESLYKLAHTPESEPTDGSTSRAFLEAIVQSRDGIDVLLQFSEAAAMPRIELLDEVAMIADDWELRARCLDILRSLCGTSGLLPKSFQLAAGSLTRQAGRPEGSGGFAIIWKGDYGGRAVALKVFRGYETGDVPHQDLEAILKEAVVWKHLRHRNIVPFVGIDCELFPLSLVCEWMPHGTVMAYLSRNCTCNRLQLLHDIAEGLKYLHEMGVVHGDLKGVNVLVNEDGVACLSDFGLAALGHQGKLTTMSVAAWSSRWIAPEILDPEAFGLKKAQLTRQSDIYSFSMVAWEIFTGLLPFHEVKYEGAIYGRILKGMRPKRIMGAAVLGLTDAVWDLINQCWRADSEMRPEISGILVSLEDAMRHIDTGSSFQPPMWPLISE
ncbi:hypothetical protein CERSUDRAFT_84290 [Gelatoporia subvermispora B]|uniref:Protein kinase domain-containing protein n=1 Tax=Ceriporiopsis subvermispora (strain B) TaxID=914234 RepID=M2QGP8_CERS8|nr:hypothetical protein CERSUDRAFT_84290 [Gelatoporia subvermispora B]